MQYCLQILGFKFNVLIGVTKKYEYLAQYDSEITLQTVTIVPDLSKHSHHYEWNAFEKGNKM